MSPPGPIALVVNPAATNSGPGIRGEVASALAPLGLEWSLVTTGPGDAARLAADVAAQGAAVVVSLGGDGIANEVAGALAGGPVAMAPLPGGNANVFSRAIGWPNSTRAALPPLRAALEAGRVREARLGLLTMDGGERVFAVNAGVGLDAATVEWIEARPRTKRRLRQAGFVLGAAIAAARSGRAPRLRASADGGRARPGAGRAGRLRHALHLPGSPPPRPGARGGLRRPPGLGRAHPHPPRRARPPGPARRPRPRAADRLPHAGRGGDHRASCWSRATRPRRCRPTASRWGATARSACAPARCCGRSSRGGVRVDP